MSIKARVQGLNLVPPQEKIVESIIVVMKEMGWTWEQMSETPFCSFMVISEELNKLAKKEKEQLKKRR